MRESENCDAIRAAARTYEETLPPEQRKQLGQYFTGLPLGRLLAHLALKSDTRGVLDPMAGHGNLLDATWEAASNRGIDLEHLAGIEIDERTAGTCRRRLAEITCGGPAQQIVAGDAFDPACVEALHMPAYDLVITNPPYVRYQARVGNSGGPEQVRSGLVAVIKSRLAGVDRAIWKDLAESYSGLADLSVPAWLLAAAMVRPGGRLALVVPATWRSRDYADVIRYLLLRCFSVECIIEDEQPGWFSDALVRTHLVVARRLSEDSVSLRVGEKTLPEISWLQVAPQASTAGSLVGAAFSGSDSEREFAAWVHGGCKESKTGIAVRPFSLNNEWAALETRIARRGWYNRLEAEKLPLFGNARLAARIAVPDVLRSILPDGFDPETLVTLEEARISLGQGLRTGCNRFFYVTARGPAGADTMLVEASSFFGHCELPAPASVLRPVLRRQSEIASLENGSVPDGRALDLRGWVLPEDYAAVVEAKAAYSACGEALPTTMPDELAAYVRRAAAAAPGGEDDDKRIPELSAVRTNVRAGRNGQTTPRFWYMLPEFAPRHLPAAFVARINHGVPWVEGNFDPPVLVDANFSTFWAANGSWSGHALKALLNSVWCRAFMEALGTPLGGGALKLEATHLRQLAIPILSDAVKTELSIAGKQLTKDAPRVQAQIDVIVLGAIIGQAASPSTTERLARALAERANDLACARRRVA